MNARQLILFGPLALAGIMACLWATASSETGTGTSSAPASDLSRERRHHEIGHYHPGGPRRHRRSRERAILQHILRVPPPARVQEHAPDKPPRAPHSIAPGVSETIAVACLESGAEPMPVFRKIIRGSVRMPVLGLLSEIGIMPGASSVNPIGQMEALGFFEAALTIAFIVVDR